MPMPPPQPPKRDLLPFAAFAVVFALAVGGYFLFPWMQRTVSYSDCIASGRVTGC